MAVTVNTVSGGHSRGHLVHGPLQFYKIVPFSWSKGNPTRSIVPALCNVWLCFVTTVSAEQYGRWRREPLLHRSRYAAAVGASDGVTSFNVPAAMLTNWNFVLIAVDIPSMKFDSWCGLRCTL